MTNSPAFNAADARPIPANPDQHRLAVAQIIADAFADGQYVDEIAASYSGSAHYDWDTTRLIFDGDRLVHHWGVWGYPMRVESVLLKVAGIGAVTTHEPYRQRGLMTLAARASLVAMRINGYDLSILRGRHYVKFGYARAWNYVTYRVQPEDIPSRALQCPYQQLGPEHIPAMEALYNTAYARYTGTCVRPTYRPLAADDMHAYGWFDGAGELAGYVRAVPVTDEQTLQCREAAGDLDQILAVLGDLFKQADYQTLTAFTVPHHHPLLGMLRRGACVVENRYFDISGWRVRMVNLTSALEKLRPVLENRLKRSYLADWQGTLVLDAGEQSAALHFEAGNITPGTAIDSPHTLRGGPDVARFLIGADDPGEIIDQAAMQCSGQAAALVEVLFPNLHPMMSQWDEF